MEYCTIGTTSLRCSRIALGTAPLGGWLWNRLEHSEAVDLVRRAVDSGITTIDTAPLYGFGRAEEIVGEAIRGRREQVQVMTKFGIRWDCTDGSHFFDTTDSTGAKYCLYRNASRSSVIWECEQSLRRLGIECIDVYQQHWPQPGLAFDETREALEELVRQGKIRVPAVSNFGVKELQQDSASGFVQSNQIPFSMAKRENGERLIPYCKANGISVIVYSPLECGILTGTITEDTAFEEGDLRGKHPLFTPDNRRRINETLKKFQPICDRHGLSIAGVVLAWTLRVPDVSVVLVGLQDAGLIASTVKAATATLDASDLSMIDTLLPRLQARE